MRHLFVLLATQATGLKYLPRGTHAKRVRPSQRHSARRLRGRRHTVLGYPCDTIPSAADETSSFGPNMHDLAKSIEESVL
jgi:hypothetical protein